MNSTFNSRPNMSEQCSADQLAIFEQMNQRGFYKTKQAPQSDITTAKQDMDTLRQQTVF